MHKTNLMALCAAFLVAAASPAFAGIIHDNGGPNGGAATFSDLDHPHFLGDIFTLPDDVTLRTVHWYGVYIFADTPTSPDNFRIQLFHVTMGVPDETAFHTTIVGDVGRTDTGADFNDSDIYAYGAAVPEVVLLAGDYLISIVNDTAADTDDNWAWVLAGPGSNFFRTADNGTWSTGPDGEPAYFLTDGVSVPEPGMLALLGLGLAGLGFARRLQRTRSQDNPTPPAPRRAAW